MNDLEMARRYISKHDNARDAGHEFLLSFCEFSRLMKVKRCKYTGIEMTTKASGAVIKGTDRTLERFDCSIGYVKGNVFAVCHYANKFKGTIENPSNDFTIEHIHKMTKFIISQEKALAK